MKDHGNAVIKGLIYRTAKFYLWDFAKGFVLKDTNKGASINPCPIWSCAKLSKSFWMAIVQILIKCVSNKFFVSSVREK